MDQKQMNRDSSWDFTRYKPLYAAPDDNLLSPLLSPYDLTDQHELKIEAKEPRDFLERFEESPFRPTYSEDTIQPIYPWLQSPVPVENPAPPIVKVEGEVLDKSDDEFKEAGSLSSNQDQHSHMSSDFGASPIPMEHANGHEAVAMPHMDPSTPIVFLPMGEVSTSGEFLQFVFEAQAMRSCDDELVCILGKWNPTFEADKATIMSVQKESSIEFSFEHAKARNTVLRNSKLTGKHSQLTFVNGSTLVHIVASADVLCLTKPTQSYEENTILHSKPIKVYTAELRKVFAPFTRLPSWRSLTSKVVEHIASPLMKAEGMHVHPDYCRLTMNSQNVCIGGDDTPTLCHKCHLSKLPKWYVFPTKAFMNIKADCMRLRDGVRTAAVRHHLRPCVCTSHKRSSADISYSDRDGDGLEEDTSHSSGTHDWRMTEQPSRSPSEFPQAGGRQAKKPRTRAIHSSDPIETDSPTTDSVHDDANVQISTTPPADNVVVTPSTVLKAVAVTLFIQAVVLMAIAFTAEQTPSMDFTSKLGHVALINHIGKQQSLPCPLNPTQHSIKFCTLQGRVAAYPASHLTDTCFKSTTSMQITERMFAPKMTVFAPSLKQCPLDADLMASTGPEQTSTDTAVIIDSAKPKELTWQDMLSGVLMAVLAAAQGVTLLPARSRKQSFHLLKQATCVVIAHIALSPSFTAFRKLGLTLSDLGEIGFEGGCFLLLLAPLVWKCRSGIRTKSPSRKTQANQQSTSSVEATLRLFDIVSPAVAYATFMQAADTSTSLPVKCAMALCAVVLTWLRAHSPTRVHLHRGWHLECLNMLRICVLLYATHAVVNCVACYAIVSACLLFDTLLQPYIDHQLNLFSLVKVAGLLLLSGWVTVGLVTSCTSLVGLYALHCSALSTRAA